MTGAKTSPPNTKQTAPSVGFIFEVLKNKYIYACKRLTDLRQSLLYREKVVKVKNAKQFVARFP